MLFDGNKGCVYLKIFVDKISIEVFVDDGKIVLINEVFLKVED